MFSRDRIQYKSVEQIQHMRQAGLIVGRTLELLRSRVKAGMTTLEVNDIAEEFIRSCGAVPSFLGYGQPPFSGTLCLSINDEVVHGIPGDRKLAQGDLLSIDCGAIIKDSQGTGWHGDAAISVIIGGDGASADEELLAVTEQALWAGIGALECGQRLFNVGDAVDDFISAQPREYGIVEDYVGHGIGTELHQAPSVPNYRVRDRGPKVRAGLVIAIEPMITHGSAQTVLRPDGWTVATADGSQAAHFEHSVAALADGLWVLTALDGGKSRLGAGYAGLD